MTKFCNTHIVERSNQELKDRLVQLEKKEKTAPLGPGLIKEKERIENLLRKREPTKTLPPEEYNDDDMWEEHMK